jgi:hypothetical protein
VIRHLKPTEVAGIRAQLLKKQGGVCAVCGQKILGRDVAVLDHDHDTGFIRGVLHSSCNGIEGRMKSLAHRSHKGVLSADYIIGLGKYLEHHKVPRIGAFHPTYKTPQQKKDATNAKARKARAAKKAGIR